MRIGYHRRRLADVARSLRLARELGERERWPRERLIADQQRRLEGVVRHAIEHSRFYRERLGAHVGDGPIELTRLPVLEKDELMARFDDLVCDRHLRRDDVLGWVERLERDELHLGRYRAMATSGSSGRKGLFVYDAEGWRSILAQFLRFNAMAGIRPRVPRLRIAAITGAGPTHMSRQASASMNVGLHRITTFDVTTPVEQLVDKLNRFDPDVLHAFPSVAAQLAGERVSGRLRISPATVTTSSELRTPAMTERIGAAFGVAPFDLYGTTEGLWGCECDRHDGIHLFEDATLVENVDADGRPVPPGEQGARLLVTNLDNRVQPIIRLAVADAVTIDPDPCPCGRSLVRVRSVAGRSDDILELPGVDGRPISVHPLEFAIVTRDRDVREFQVVDEGTLLRILVVASGETSSELEARLQAAVSTGLVALGAQTPTVVVERRDELERSPGGKLQIVVSAADRGPRGAVNSRRRPFGVLADDQGLGHRHDLVDR